jgi:hypothetical protein
MSLNIFRGRHRFSACGFRPAFARLALPVDAS